MVEEAGFQACEKLSRGERVCWEVVFSQRESNTIYGALRITDSTYCRDSEREVKQSMDFAIVKVYTPWWNKHVVNDIPGVVGVRRLLGRILPVALCSFPVTSA